MVKNIRILLVVTIVLLSAASGAQLVTDIGNGFYCHGVAAPISQSRGFVATVDGNGKNIVLVWLMDHRGGYELLLIDATTGESEEFPIPFSPNCDDGPFASILSSRNRYYAHFNSHFIEFDISQRAFTFVSETAPKTAMSMTEDDNGIIWSATYPQCGVVSYNPQTGKFKDYGQIHRENWSQYPRYIAADDKGWIYFALGETASQIVALDPSTSKGEPILPEAERKNGLAYVYRDLNGKVYGNALKGSSDEWYEFYGGKGKKIGKHTTINEKSYVAGMQGLCYDLFPGGQYIKSLDLEKRQLVIYKHSSQIKVLHFEYQSEGSRIMSVGVAPDGTICGGTFFPKYFFSYNLKTDQSLCHPCYGQCNTVVSQQDKLFIGGYTKGFLLEWDPSQAWVPTEKAKSGCNPLFRCEGTSNIYRPHKLLSHKDGHTLILAGTPGYGLTGGGLLFWDRETKKMQLLKHTEIVPEQSTKSLVSLSDKQILGGTTISPGTGGAVKASVAELYLMNVDSKKLLWHQVVLPSVREYSDLCLAKNGLVYGIADKKIFFVFDVIKRKIVFQASVSGPIANQQGSRIFIASPHNIYILYYDGIAQVDPETYKITRLVTSPVPITAGGDFLDGRIYFGSDSNLYSYIVEPQVQQKLSSPTSLELH
jgi:streptogramin lyase